MYNTKLVKGDDYLTFRKWVGQIRLFVCSETPGLPTLTMPAGVKKSSLFVDPDIKSYMMDSAVAEEFAMRLVFEEGWEEVEYSESLRVKAYLYPQTKTPIISKGWQKSYQTVFGDFKHTHHGYHNTGLNHDHWAMKNDHTPVEDYQLSFIEAPKQSGKTVDAQTDFFIQGIKDRYGIKVILHEKQDPYTLIATLVMVSSSGELLQLKKILAEEAPILNQLQLAVSDFVSFVLKEGTFKDVLALKAGAQKAQSEIAYKNPYYY
jgi:hypothetical protein